MLVAFHGHLNLLYLFEVVSHLECIFLLGYLCLNLRVGVVDDGQEHVEKHEEHKEHIQDEVDGTKDTVGSLQLMEVEVSQDDSEQCESNNKKHRISGAVKFAVCFKIVIN